MNFRSYYDNHWNFFFDYYFSQLSIEKIDNPDTAYVCAVIVLCCYTIVISDCIEAVQKQQNTALSGPK
jgi:hypothetical protein